jgi:hypothetical protein
LILLADRMTERRVSDGSLGCPNCRDRYPVTSGFADLRPPPRDPVTPPEGGGPPVDALAVAALLGIPGGPGNVLLSARVAASAEALAQMVEGIEWILLGSAPGEAAPEGPFSPMAVRGRLPLYSRSLRGVVAVGEEGPVGVPELARVVAPMGRLVVLDPPPGIRDQVAAAGLEVVLDAPEAVVGARKS